MNYVLISMLLFSRICKVYAKKICVMLADYKTAPGSGDVLGGHSM